MKEVELNNQNWSNKNEEEQNKQIKAFIDNINSQSYISTYLYQRVWVNHPSIIPKGFNLEAYNDNVLEL